MKKVTLKVTQADYKRIMASLEERRGRMFDYCDKDKSEDKRVSTPILNEAYKINNLINTIIQ